MRARALTLATLVSRGLLGRSRYRRRAARFGEMLPAREGGGTRETGLVLFSRPLFVPKKGLMLGVSPSAKNITSVGGTKAEQEFLHGHCNLKDTRFRALRQRQREIAPPATI